MPRTTTTTNKTKPTTSHTKKATAQAKSPPTASTKQPAATSSKQVAGTTKPRSEPTTSAPKSRRRASETQVGDLMTRNVVTCNITDSLNTAAGLMWDHDCGVVPVLDHDNQVVGMLTDRDICMASYTQGRLLHDISVGDAMARTVVSCGVTDPVEKAVTAMQQQQVRRLPVVDNDRHVVGIVSLSDVARRTASELEKSQPKLSAAELTQTLAAVGTRRTSSTTARS